VPRSALKKDRHDDAWSEEDKQESETRMEQEGQVREIVSLERVEQARESETIMDQEGHVRERVSLERVEQARERDRQRATLPTESSSPSSDKKTKER
jgi:hypothetical protein